MSRYVARKIPPGAEILCRRSWTGYLSPAMPAVLLFMAAYPISLFVPAAGPLLISFGAAILILALAHTRSSCLYIDELGVWEFSGIFPWARGVRGVHWRDLDDAAYSMNAIGWLLNSYDVTIRHRYKADQQITLRGQRNGHRAVHRINERHADGFGAGRVE